MGKFLRQYEILFIKAKGDFKIVEKNINDKEIDIEIMYFHLQQCAEKLLKCLLSFNQIHFSKVYDIKKSGKSS